MVVEGPLQIAAVTQPSGQHPSKDAQHAAGREQGTDQPMIEHVSV